MKNYYRKACGFVVGAAVALVSAVPAFAVVTPDTTTIPEMFGLVDFAAISAGQKVMYAALITATLVSVAWAIVTKITKKAPRAV